MIQCPCDGLGEWKALLGYSRPDNMSGGGSCAPGDAGSWIYDECWWLEILRRMK